MLDDVFLLVFLRSMQAAESKRFFVFFLTAGYNLCSSIMGKDHWCAYASLWPRGEVPQDNT